MVNPKLSHLTLPAGHIGHPELGRAGLGKLRDTLGLPADTQGETAVGTCHSLTKAHA